MAHNFKTIYVTLIYTCISSLLELVWTLKLSECEIQAPECGFLVDFFFFGENK